MTKKIIAVFFLTMISFIVPQNATSVSSSENPINVLINIHCDPMPNVSKYLFC